MRRHFIAAGILVVVITILTYAVINFSGLATQMNPVAASAQAGSIDALWHFEIIVISFLFALITGPIVYSLVVFRRRAGDTTDAAHIEGNSTLEITWTVIPLIFVMFLAYWGAYSLGETRRVAANPLIIQVQAQQFDWSFIYPEYNIISNELHLPVDRQVVLKMESKDVIHSFWVPEFRVKQDVVPGRITEYRITPSLIGSYKVRCSELCGTHHAYMERPVVVSSQADYDAWIKEQVALAVEMQKSPEGVGQRLVAENGCLGCHTIDGSPKAAPTWLGLYGEHVTLADGTVVTADDAYISRAILQPAADVVQGYQVLMQPYPFTDAQVASIIAYIKTLK
ncbi:MAG: cytochrome c oxidase subunit II [Anaerolineales bacterium]|nr:cytochrome c oxidase subunit II [Anaerolineales bacterium]